ncbi:MAG TPA: AMP-binding protein [Acidimicrobiales bacterium]|nr:AMP-binding protein [Acidimicrobiales bacterium]
MLLHQLIDSVAASDPERTAVHFGDEVISFADLSARSMGAAIVVAGVTEPGDRVAIVGENHPSWLECYYGVPRAGRILVFLNHRLAAAELASILHRSGASLLIGPRSELDRLRSLAAEFPEVRTILDLDQWTSLVRAARDRQPDPPDAGDAPGPAGEDAPAWLIYTSGTTGSPKGAMLTHHNFGAAIEASEHGRPVSADDVFLYPFPLCHVAGYNVLRLHAAGRPVVVMDRFEAAGFVDGVHRHRVTSVTMTATMVSSLLDHLDAHPEDRRRLGSLRQVAYGAAPMPPSLLRRAIEVLGVDFAQGYGMTELSGNATFLDADAHHRALAGAEHLLAAAGRPAPNVEVRVVDEAMADVPVGESGEIVVRGAQVMAGYWMDEDATQRAFSDGWFHTGDVGTFDGEGWLYVVDRKKDVIVTGAENVSSREVEDAILAACPEIREAAVVGVPDPHWGENVCAVIVLRPSSTIDPAELNDRVRRRLAGFKVPRHVVALDELPRNATGKVLKQQLRQWLAEHPDQVGPRR